MKNLIYKCAILCTMTLLCLSSCEEFIDLQPLDQVSTEYYWTTPGDLENYTKHFYGELPSPLLVFQDANSDNIVSETPDPLMNGERTTRTGNWQYEWSFIRDVNIFFENYQNVEADFDSYKHYLGEAHFFRAWFYFNLLKRYGDVPWYSEVIELDDEEALLKARDPRTLVADSILADLEKASEYLDGRAVAGNNRLNKEAALAFKTRVALYEGSWQKYHAGTEFGTQGADPNKYFQASVEAAEELMNGTYQAGIYNTGNPDEDYYELFGYNDMSDINEVLFYRAYNADEGLGNREQYYITYGRNSVSWELVSSYLGKDGNPYNYLELSETTKGNDFLTKIAEDADPRLKSTIFTPGDLIAAQDSITFDTPNIDGSSFGLSPSGFTIRKSANPNSPAAGLPWVGPLSETGFIFFRYGEVLLNYAEAKYELEGTVAYEQLNMLRNRAGMPGFVVNPQSADPSPVDYGYPVSDALYEIRRERRVELALEGYRADDYMRWAAHALFQGKKLKGYPFDPEEFPEYNPPLDENGLIEYNATQIPNGFQFRPNQDYLTSIPQDEITLNPKLEQNPGW